MTTVPSRREHQQQPLRTRQSAASAEPINPPSNSQRPRRATEPMPGVLVLPPAIPARSLQMPIWTCEQCGAQFPESDTPLPSCPICEDERQYVNWKGQRWLSREELARTHKAVWRDDLELVGIGL